MRALLLIVMVLFALAGCQSKDSQIIGIWKLDPVKPNPRFVKMGFIPGNFMSVEFMDKGQFRYMTEAGSGSGRYEWKGDDLNLTFSSLAPTEFPVLRLEGADLVEVKDVPADVKMRLRKTNLK